MEQPTNFWQQTFDVLNALHSLPDNWDGEGSDQPKSENVDAAIAWAKIASQDSFLPPPTHISAGGVGEVLLTWFLGGHRLEGEFSEPGKVDWMITGQVAMSWNGPLMKQIRRICEVKVSSHT